MSDEIKPPYTPGDVVILNSSPDIPMTVEACFVSIGEFVCNVQYLDAAGKWVRKGFAANMLSLYKPVTDFIQPVGYKRSDERADE